MTLYASPGIGTVGEDATDLRTYLHSLEGCPRIEQTQALSCVHHPNGEDASWFYVEADGATGVARRRCVACADAVHLLDSAERWTHPPMHSCQTCMTSIMELTVGLHIVDDRVQWLALAARCVECGRVVGLTDAWVPGLSVAEVSSSI